MEGAYLDILNSAARLFMRFGIKSVSMDDIAREQGMSKKTLYKYFESKKDLVKKVALAHNDSEKESICAIRDKTQDAVHEMVLIARYVHDMLKDIRPSVIFDLKKYYRQSWKLFESLHNEFVYSTIKSNIERGRIDGLYREDFNEDIIARFYTGMTLIITEEQLFPEKSYPIEAIYNQFMNYHLNAILTAKGRKLFQKYINQ